MYVEPEMDLPVRLPLTDRTRLLHRDAKLDRREEERAQRRGETRRTCPCNICLGQNHSMRPRKQVQSHLAIYGRHPYHRKSTAVSKSHYDLSHCYRYLRILYNVAEIIFFPSLNVEAGCLLNMFRVAYGSTNSSIWNSIAYPGI